MVLIPTNNKQHTDIEVFQLKQTTIYYLFFTNALHGHHISIKFNAEGALHSLNICNATDITTNICFHKAHLKSHQELHLLESIT